MRSRLPSLVYFDLLRFSTQPTIQGFMTSKAQSENFPITIYHDHYWDWLRLWHQNHILLNKQNYSTFFATFSKFFGLRRSGLALFGPWLWPFLKTNHDQSKKLWSHHITDHNMKQEAKENSCHKASWLSGLCPWDKPWWSLGEILWQPSAPASDVGL